MEYPLKFGLLPYISLSDLVFRSVEKRRETNEKIIQCRVSISFESCNNK